MNKIFSNVLLAGVLALVLFCGNVVYAESSEVYQFQQEMLRLVNIERTKYGLRPLVLDKTLTDGAMIRAREISSYFSHTRPNGSSCFTVLPSTKHYLGENIAAGRDNVADTVIAWMNSSGHRANILNPKFDSLGVGYFYSQNTEYGYYWVQMFRGR